MEALKNQNFTLTLTFDQSPHQVFDAVTNVRGWWSEEIEGNTQNLNDEFEYHHLTVHRSKMRLVEVVPDRKVVWQVLDNFFSFTEDKNEWIGTKVIFDISQEGDKTRLDFTHEGLTPAYECYSACSSGWTQYIAQSLPKLITTGTGLPNKSEKVYTTHEVAARFNELSRQEKWFEIQDELFSNDVKSIDPAHSPYFGYAEGKLAVRKKGEDWVKRITAAYRLHTTDPVIAGNHFAVGREVDIEVEGFGRVQLNEIMLYEVKNGKIVSEQFFY
jgi:uncharacterized protein YndB with AHSA1/START domain